MDGGVVGALAAQEGTVGFRTLQRTTTVSENDPDTANSPNCRAGETPIAGGWYVDGAGSFAVDIYNSYPDGQAWAIDLFVPASAAAPATVDVTVHVTCAVATAP